MQQQFLVPQFIDVEAKIIGPITARQFLIVLGAGLLIALFYKIFTFNVFLICASITAIIAGVFAFVKISGRPFHYFVLNIIQTFKRPAIRIWNNKIMTTEIEEKVIAKKDDYKPEAKKQYEASRLAELSLIVDTSGKYRGNNPNDNQKDKK